MRWGRFSIPFSRCLASDMNGGILKICAISLLCVTVGIISRTLSGSVATAVKIAGILLVFSGAMLMMSDVLEAVGDVVEEFSESSQINAYWGVMLRALGIAVLCRICTDICRDCGEGAIAGGVETAGKIAILFLSLPMVKQIIDYARELLSRA